MNTHPGPSDRDGRSGGARDLLIAGAAVAVFFALSVGLGWVQHIESALRSWRLFGETVALVFLLLAGVAFVAARRSTQAEHERRARRAAEAKFQTLIEQSPAVAYTWDATRRERVYVAPQIEPLTGYSVEAWMSGDDVWARFVHPDDIDHLRALSRHADETGEPFFAEYRIRAKDGRTIWLREEANYVQFDGDHPLLAQGVIYDITALKGAEAATEQAEAKFRDIVERVPAVAYVWDSGKAPGAEAADYISPQIEALLGYTAAEWLQEPKVWGDRVHPDDLQPVLDAWYEAIQNRSAYVAEYRIRRADGSWAWIRDEANAVGEGENGAPLYQGVMLDVTERREAEERLRGAEARWRDLLERLPVVAFTIEHDLDAAEPPYRWVAPGIVGLTGIGPEDWVADPGAWERALHPEDRERATDAFRTLMRAGGVLDIEYRMVRSDGSVVWVREQTASEIDGSRSRADGVFLDVTAQHEAETALGQAEDRFRSLVEQLPAITYIEDPRTGNTVYVSPQIEEMYGIAPEDWLADPTLWEQRIHPDDHAWVLAANDSDAGDTWSVDYRTMGDGGRMLWVHNEAVLLRDEDGEPLYWQGLVFDITERKLAEERVREAEERYRLLVEQMPVVVYTDAVDELSTALYVSPQYERLTGYTQEQRLLDPGLWQAMLHPEDREWVVAESARTDQTGDPFDVEYRIVAADGRTVWVHDRAILVHDPDGRPIWQGVLEDVTERHLSQDALDRRDAILQATGFAAQQFLRSDSWQEALAPVLERFGVASEVSRAYVYANSEDEGDLLVSLEHAWTAEGSQPGGGEIADRHSWRHGGFARWAEMLSSGEAVHGAVRDLPEQERALLEADRRGIRSLAVVPVFVDDEWWGYLGLDDSERDREWHDAEIEALRVAANTLGAAIARERSARTLSETQKRYQTLVEQIPAMTYIESATDNTAVYHSPQAYEILGYGPGEWGSQKAWAKALHPEDRDRVLAEDRRTNETGDPFQIEYRLIAKDGRTVWVRDHAVLVHDEDGTPLYWQGVRTDITTEKGAEQQILEAERRYRGLIETIPAVTYVDTLTVPIETLYVSPQVQTLLGYTPEQWTGQPDAWRPMIHPDDLAAVDAEISRHHETGGPYEAEYRFRHGDGRWLWVRDQAIVVRDEDGAALFSQGVIYDVTATKEAEERLRDAEDRYRGIVEHVPAAIYVDLPDASMQSVYMSPQIEAIAGVTPEQWTADPALWLSLIYPEDRDTVLDTYQAAIAAGEAWSAEYRVRTPDGRTIWLHDETTIMLGEDGQAQYLQGVLFDITERKLAEQALRDSERREREAAERLRALDDMKNTFLAAVSHELRSPLTSILGLSLTLERAATMHDEDRSDLLRRLATNARKLDRLLKDLLDIDRLNRGIVEPQYRVTDVGALARRTVESLDVLAGRDLVVEAESVVLAVDPPKVERIVENLLTNAARHTDGQRRIWLSVTPHDAGVLIAVEDDGDGVPEPLRSAIFEPFHQGPTVTAHSPGTGIGLSLVARFAELHGGRAWVDDREGGGASFRVYLPGHAASHAASGLQPVEAHHEPVAPTGTE